MHVCVCVLLSYYFDVYFIDLIFSRKQLFFMVVVESCDGKRGGGILQEADAETQLPSS